MEADRKYELESWRLMGIWKTTALLLLLYYNLESFRLTKAVLASTEML